MQKRAFALDTFAVPRFVVTSGEWPCSPGVLPFSISTAVPGPLPAAHSYWDPFLQSSDCGAAATDPAAKRAALGSATATLPSPMCWMSSPVSTLSLRSPMSCSLSISPTSVLAASPSYAVAPGCNTPLMTCEPSLSLSPSLQLSSQLHACATAPPRPECPWADHTTGRESGHSRAAYGVRSVIGRRARMEDAFTMYPALVVLPPGEGDRLVCCAPDDTAAAGAAAASGSNYPTTACAMDTDACACEDTAPGPSGTPGCSSAEQRSRVEEGLATGFRSGSTQPQGGEAAATPDMLDYYAVFDGHGGDGVARLAAAHLHVVLAADIGRQLCGGATRAGGSCGNCGEGGSGGGHGSSSSEAAAAAAAAAAVDNSNSMAAAASVGMDAAARGGGASGNMSVAMALRRAFQETDSLVCAADAGAGSTAVTAVICRSTLWVASVGDSRAVLCRGGAAVALTEDHKPEREDEAARVQAAGGRILFNRGARVGGVLAMTRALGDHHLRCSGVVAEPDVSVTARDRVHDEFLLLASDGLWDVMSNQEAVNLASRCLERAAARGAKRSAACRVASTVLSRAALERGSRDNVTVAVVDLVGR